jgi:diguanylate cyclase (GGDEF)-like protein
MQAQILGLLTPLMALGFAVTFALMWRVGRLRRHVLGFALSYVLFASGFLITHLMPPGALYLFHTTQVLYSLGVTLFLASLCDRVGVRLNLPVFAGVYGVSAVVLAIAVGMSDDVAPRLIIVNNGYGAMFAIGMATLLLAPRRSVFDLLIIIIMGFQTVDHLVRPNLTLLFESSIPAAVYRDSVYYSLIGLVLGVKSVATAMVLIGATIAEWNAVVRASGERDALTGMRNRGAFEDEVRRLLPRAQERGNAVSLVVADIDHFKQVNDLWGHQAGDNALTRFAQLIDSQIRESDVSGRVGGEEFCVLVWDCPEDAAHRLAERIRQAQAVNPIEGLPDDLRLTASFGVAGWQAGERYSQLFARADAALYAAKQAGRDRVVSGLELRDVPTPLAPPASPKTRAA